MNSRLLSVFRLPLFLSCLVAATWGTAQPSGGPYGPISQCYELPAAERIFYVSVEGDPAAEGLTIDNPTTIESAIARVVTGDAIVMRDGTYRTGSLRVNQGITIQPFEAEEVVIKGTEIATDWEPTSDGRWVATWTRLFPFQPADWWRAERHVDETPLHLFNNDMVFRDGELLGAVGSRDDVTADTYYFDYPNARIYVGADPAGRLIEITAHNVAIDRTIRPVHGKENDGRGMTLRGLTFTQYAYQALHVEGIEPSEHLDPSLFGKEVVGTLFEHLTITHCSRVAGYFRGDGFTMRHCLVADTGTEGIYVINSADILLERNIVTRINSAEKLTGYYATAVKIFNQTHNAVFRDNLIIDNPHANGVWYDVGNVDGVFINNHVENTPAGFFFEISQGAVCAGNVFVDCVPGVWALNAAGVNVTQNTFINSTARFQRTLRSHTAGDHFGWHASAGPDVAERHSHALTNNLMVGDASFERALVAVRQSEGGPSTFADPQLDAFDGNLYVRAPGADEPLIEWSPGDSADESVTLATPADLHARHGEFAAADRVVVDADLAEIDATYQLPPNLRGARSGIQVDPKIRKLLGWPEAEPFAGAYAPDA